jgi:rhodanese-related sulfurtransferase
LPQKWLQRQWFIRSLRMSRITLEELRRLMDERKDTLILDVRPPDVRAAEGIIPGAVAAHPAEIKSVIAMYSGDQETIVYCACPNEASAATAAKHLRRAGFKRIRPLLGGIDAWVKAGHPIERHASQLARQYDPPRRGFSCGTTMLCATSSLPC